MTGQFVTAKVHGWGHAAQQAHARRNAADMEYATQMAKVTIVSAPHIGMGKIVIYVGWIRLECGDGGTHQIANHQYVTINVGHMEYVVLRQGTPQALTVIALQIG